MFIQRPCPIFTLNRIEYNVLSCFRLLLLFCSRSVECPAVFMQITFVLSHFTSMHIIQSLSVVTEKICALMYFIMSLARLILILTYIQLNLTSYIESFSSVSVYIT